MSNGAGIQVPFPVFMGLNGKPLDAGYIYIGTAGLDPETNPISVYWDEALTIPAPQPIRTELGYPVRSGTPAAVFVGQSYSLTVRDHRSQLVYTVLSNNPLEAAIGNSSDPAMGDALVAVKRTDLANSIATNQHNVNQAQPVDIIAHYGIVLGATSGAQRIANANLLNQALVDAKATGVSIRLPAGRIEFNGTIQAQNGVNVSGHGNMGEGSSTDWIGSTLAYYGSGTAINMKGTSVSADTRIVCRWSDFILDGTNSTGNSVGIVVGWNQRAQPLLSNVTIKGMRKYGLHHDDQNWNVSFDNLRLDLCGTQVSNGAGIFKTISVDSGSLNAITFNNLQVEACGRTDSVAGGINWQSTTAGNRGLYFNDAIIEGNAGTDEVFISNCADVNFKNVYVERLGASTSPIGIEVSSCVVNMRGGYIAGESKTHDMSGASGQKILTFAGVAPAVDAQVGMFVIGAGIAPGSKVASVQPGIGFTLDTNTTGTLSSTSVRYGFPQYALKASGGSTVIVDGVAITGWLGAMARSEGTSYIHTRLVQPGSPNPVGYSGDSTAQWLGDYAPRFRVEKGGTNQTGIVDSAFTKVTWPTSIYDVTGAVASDKFTPQALGRYRLSATVLFSGIPDQSQLLIAIYKNGSAYSVTALQSSSSGNANTSPSISTDVDVTSVTDYFEVYVRCVASGAPATTISGAAGYTRFEGFRIQ